MLGAMAVLAAAAAPIRALPPETPSAGPVAPPVMARAEPAGPVMRQIRFEAPLRGYRVNSAFGLRKLAAEARARAHSGVDIAAPKGTSVYVVAEGEVVRTGHQRGGYGAFVEVRHPNGLTSLYAHLSRIDVASGMTLGAGDRIGLVGSTGYSTGPHLHLEIRRAGRALDPSRVLGTAFAIPAQASAA